MVFMEVEIHSLFENFHLHMVYFRWAICWLDGSFTNLLVFTVKYWYCDKNIAYL